ncbi:MAG: DUF512 domain-containing protein, partial [Firmicutes bacterium]|nr:DUF512 domain-containing protein [Bacillota bacterium]
SLSVGAGKKAPAMPTSANVSQGTSTRNSARAARPGPWTLITGLRSLAVVPVGLTRHRQRLYPLRTFTREEARTIVQQVADWQEEFRQRFSYTFVFLADEFYLLAGEDFPPYETYEDFPQWENGVGMAADFLRNLDEVLGSLSVGAGKKAPAMPTSANVSQGTSTRNSARAARPGPWTLITGRSAQDLIKKMAEGFNQRFEGVNLDVLPVVNGFFGPTVSVTGLLTGQDILAAARNVRPRGLLLPEVMLREGHFLDDMTLPELSTQLGVPVQAVPSNPSGLAGFLLGDR